MMREVFDAKIIATFQQLFMDSEGYDSLDEMMEDSQFKDAGHLLAACMITGVGPTPDDFYKHGLLDNLQGLENVEYTVLEGRPGYKMDVDQTGTHDDPVIFVFEQNGDFVMEIVKYATPFMEE